MKKRILLMCSFTAALSLTSWGQTKAGLQPASGSAVKQRSTLPSHEKTLLCLDTLRYPQAKQQILGNPANFYTFGIYQADNEAFSQTFINSASISVRGIEFLGANNTTDGTASVSVTASLYAVNASNVPTTLITSGISTFTSTTPGYHYVTFATPATVTGNYAVVIQATSLNGVFDVYVNDPTPGQPYDETLARFKSAYYASSNNNWIAIPALTEIGNNNFEPILAPMVSYTINTSFTVATTPACLGTPVTFTNTSTPAAALSNRMLNYQVFRTYFGTAPQDSTFVYDHDNASPLVWNANHTYTYPAAGTYSVDLAVNGGFWNSCFDIATVPVTINPVPATPTVAAGGATSFCAGGSVTLTSSAATGNVWSNGATTQAITVSTAGTYTVAVTAAGCTSGASSAQTVTVSPVQNASFAYSSSTLCTGGANETPTVTTPGGTFTSTAGIVLNASTGTIDMGASTNGTYNITYTNAGTCPGTVSHSVTITTAPDATFSYANAAYCTAGTDPMPVFGPGTSGGAFSATTGLALNTSTGAIDVSSSTAGTYTVTNTIAAAGVCPADAATFSVTINTTPSATVTGGGTQCGPGSFPVTVALTGTGPWNFSYSDGTTTTNITAQATSPYTINATTSGTYTVSNVTASTCSAAGTGSATVLFNTNPVVMIATLTAVCEDAVAVTLTATPAGGTFAGTGVTGTTFDPAVSGAGTFPITYNFTDANGCSGSASASMTVNTVPVAAMTALADMCVYNTAVTLSGGTPAGGTYSGTGVTGNTFNPATAGVGSHAITYTVTVNGCSDEASQTVVVDACLGVNEIDEANLLIVPNPASDFITISYSNGAQSDVNLSLTSADGKIVAYRTISAATEFSEKMDVSTCAAGMYFVKLTSNSGTVTKKVIVQ